MTHNQKLRYIKQYETTRLILETVHGPMAVLRAYNNIKRSLAMPVKGDFIHAK